MAGIFSQCLWQTRRPLLWPYWLSTSSAVLCSTDLPSVPTYLIQGLPRSILPPYQQLARVQSYPSQIEGGGDGTFDKSLGGGAKIERERWKIERPLYLDCIYKTTGTIFTTTAIYRSQYIQLSKFQLSDFTEWRVSGKKWLEKGGRSGSCRWLRLKGIQLLFNYLLYSILLPVFLQVYT